VFYGLEDLHVLPNVNYLAKVRHTDGVWGPGDEHQEMIKSEKTESEKHS
jgi:hypothetical protein